MSTCEFYVPKDLMEAEPETELSSSDLDTDVSLQQPDMTSSTPKRRKSWRFWKQWTSKVDFIVEEQESKQEEEHPKELVNLNPKKQNGWTEELQEFNETPDLAEEIQEKPVKEKSIRRRFLNWVNGAFKTHNEKKMARTYRRELEEGNHVYRTSYMVPVWSRAQREQRKREKLLRRDERRQKIKRRLDDYWEKKKDLKEELKLKEEERYEKWMTAHGLSVPLSSPEEPKTRMSKWEKRFLRMKEFFFQQSSNNLNNVDEDAE